VAVAPDPPERPGRHGRARRRLRRPLVLAVAGLCLLGASSGLLALRGARPASADASGPPDYSVLTDCPGQQNPPAGYAVNGTYRGHSDPQTVESNLNSGQIGYLIPFRGTIGRQAGVDNSTVSDAGGEVVIPSVNPSMPALIIPHIYGVVCGLITLPELKGIISGSNLKLSSVNAYIGSAPQVSQAFPDAIEALPLAVTFPGFLSAGVLPTPAHNGGLDVTLAGATSATISLDGTPGVAPNALGTSCPLNIPTLSFSTLNSAQINGFTVDGQPVTGPVENGQAEVVSNPFAVPAITTGPTCPTVVAQAVNKLLGLPLPAGRAIFVAPFTFDFEINQ
jgi:hypothetical protein